jgi:hypothetical protein
MTENNNKRMERSEEESGASGEGVFESGDSFIL